MSPVVETILFVFGLVALGYLAGLTGYLKAEVRRRAHRICRRRRFATAPLPHHGRARIFMGPHRGRSGRPISLQRRSPGAAGRLVMTRIFGAIRKPASSAAWATAYSNLVLLGIPFMLGVFGRGGFRGAVAAHRRALAGHERWCRSSSSTCSATGKPAIGAGRGSFALLRRVAANSLMIGILPA